MQEHWKQNKQAKQEPETGIRNMNKQGRSKNNQKHQRIEDELARTGKHSVDSKYTGEWTLYAGILGREEELNNYERWITNEGNTDITRVTRYADRITHKA